LLPATLAHPGLPACLLKDPRARLGTAREVADALNWPGTVAAAPDGSTPILLIATGQYLNALQVTEAAEVSKEE